MWQWWVILTLSWLASQSVPDQLNTTKPGSVSIVQNNNEDKLSSGPNSIIAQVALTAMDRQCGNCHHPNRSTNKAALAIFDLADECWYCPLSLSQAADIKKRTKSSSFSEEEQNAIAALLDQLNSNN